MKYAGVLCVTTAFLVAATLALPGRAVAVSHHRCAVACAWIAICSRVCLVSSCLAAKSDQGDADRT
eukprot:scaffold4_cov396-Prasinococcus_capsulatus_cf.AAC.16